MSGSRRPTENTAFNDLTSLLPVKNPGNLVLLLDGAMGAVFYCSAASSGTGTVEAQYREGGAWVPVNAYEYASGAGTTTFRVAGTTITAAAGDVIYVFAPGAFAVRWNLAGTSVTMTARTFDNMSDVIMNEMVNGAGFASLARSKIREVTLTFSLDTNVYANGDVLADSQLLASVVRQNDAKGYLISFQLTDEDDNTAVAMDLVLLSANVSLGTENSAVSISDANARNIIAQINILAADWNDIINSKQVTWGGGKPPLPWPISPVAGSDDIYVGLILRSGTPTYTASGITGRFFFLDAD